MAATFMATVSTSRCGWRGWAVPGGICVLEREKIPRVAIEPFGPQMRIGFSIEITSRLANALGVELIAAEAARPGERSDALDYILRGRATHWRQPRSRHSWVLPHTPRSVRR